MHPAINFYLGNSSRGCRITPLAAASKMSFPGLEALLCSRRSFRSSNLYINSLCIMAVQSTVCLQNGEASAWRGLFEGSTVAAACRPPRSAEALLARGRLILGSLLPLQSPQPGAAAGNKKSG